MEESFPKEEYRDYEKQKELFTHSEYQIFIKKDKKSGEINAFFAVWEFDFFMYVEHFAVNPAMRNGVSGVKC